jgi:hypothetical protein
MYLGVFFTVENIQNLSFRPPSLICLVVDWTWDYKLAKQLELTLRVFFLLFLIIEEGLELNQSQELSQVLFDEVVRGDLQYRGHQQEGFFAKVLLLLLEGVYG